MTSKAEARRARQVWLAICGHPFPLRTRLLCRDRRFSKGFVIGNVFKYYQEGFKYYPEQIDLRKSWSYALLYTKSWIIWKSADSVIRVVS